MQKDTEGKAALNMQRCKLGCREEERREGEVGSQLLFSFRALRCDGSHFFSKGPNGLDIFPNSLRPDIFSQEFLGRLAPFRTTFGKQGLPSLSAVPDADRLSYIGLLVSRERRAAATGSV